MDDVIISGIQQVGIGVRDVHEAWAWYYKYFGIDIRILEDSSLAEFMLPYTGGKPRNRHAALTISLTGGGGFEIWSHTDFKPRPASFEIQLGDLGFYAAKIRCVNTEKAYEWFINEKQEVIGNLENVEDNKQFFLKDPFGNIFHMVPGNDWLLNENKMTGASHGVIIGCSDIENSMDFYDTILGYDTVVYDKTGVFEDFAPLPGGDKEFRRVLLRHSKPRKGPFSSLFGNSEMELVQVLNRKPKKIFEGRFWGELGFIHLCFDIRNMDALRDKCEEYGSSFTVDTGKIFKENSFDMGDAAGIFSYIEDPDGALIEFVETHKIPVFKKLGISLNLKKRDPEKPLPMYILKAMRFLRAKDIGTPKKNIRR